MVRRELILEVTVRGVRTESGLHTGIDYVRKLRYQYLMSRGIQVYLILPQTDKFVTDRVFLNDSE